MNESVKLLDNGWQILVFKDGLGQYTALAVREYDSVDDALDRWAEPTEPPGDESLEQTCDRLVFGGANRYAGCGRSPEDALRAVTEKVLFRRLPDEEPE